MSENKITLSQLRHLAKLARIKLTEDEEKTFLPQLDSVIEYFDILNQADTTDVSPSYQITGLKDVFRSDDIKPSLSQEEALSTATKKNNGYFVVPNTIKK